MAKARIIKNPFITVNTPSLLYFFSVSPFASLFFFPKKNLRTHKLCSAHPNPTLLPIFLFLLISVAFFGISGPRFIVPISQGSTQCPLISPSTPFSLPSPYSPVFSASVLSSTQEPRKLSNSVTLPLPSHENNLRGNVSEKERDFWKQPDGEGYKPCLDISIEYRKASSKISKEKRRFLVVEAAGGLNQQKNQIVDAVVIARILEAALVVPILKVNLIWGDASEFSDIFDVQHFQRTLQADVPVVSSLPFKHFTSKQTIPRDVSPLWLRTRFFKQLNEEGVIVLHALDSKLTKNLPPDLQKLKCKVAFHALRFAAAILEIGDKLARRMWIEGPYIALHLRLEKDVWVRTGCLTGLGPQYDDIIAKVRESRPEYLTGSLNLTHPTRRLAGLCPLNAFEMARLLKALGAPRSARIFSAGGEWFGGRQAVEPLVAEFPNIVTKEMLARDGELSPYMNKSSALAAIDYIVSLSSDVFVPSHGGNMGLIMKGHRAYVGHKKYITPNKRAMLPFFEDTSLSEAEFGSIIRKLHRKSLGQPEPRTKRKSDRDVIAYPVPECMCKHPIGIY